MTQKLEEIYCNAAICHHVKQASASSVPQPGGLCALNSSGLVVPASDKAGLVVLGRCEELLPGNKVISKTGVFIFNCGDGNEMLCDLDINQPVYVIDPFTVGKAGGANKIMAGFLRNTLPDGRVAVEVGNSMIG